MVGWSPQDPVRLLPAPDRQGLCRHDHHRDGRLRDQGRQDHAHRN